MKRRLLEDTQKALRLNNFKVQRQPFRLCSPRNSRATDSHKKGTWCAPKKTPQEGPQKIAFLPFPLDVKGLVLSSDIAHLSFLQRQVAIL